MEIEWWRKQQILERDDVIKKAVPKVDTFQYLINSTNSYIDLQQSPTPQLAFGGV
jgi:hypothetical protein